MAGLTAWMELHGQLIGWLIAGWIFLVLLASVIYRRIKDASLPTPPAAERVFDESGVSGVSQRHWLSRLGGAHNCLRVTCTAQELIIRPLFPFQLFFLPEIFDLQHRVRLGEQIASLEPGKKNRLRQWVRVRIRTRGGEYSLDLLLRGATQFIRAVNREL